MAADTAEKQELQLKVLTEFPTIPLVAADHQHLQTLYETGLFDPHSNENFTKLQSALKIVVEHVTEQRKLVERRDNTKERFISLLLTVLNPAEIDSKLANGAVEFILTPLFGQKNNVAAKKRREIILAASKQCGVIYHLLEKQRSINYPYDLTPPFRWCVNLSHLNGARNLLYIAARMPKCTLAQIISSSYKTEIVPLALAMIDMGVFCYHTNCASDDRPTEEKFDELISKIKQQPLSLQQTARLVIRATMRDVDVVKGSYKLPIPKMMQDYVGLKFLDASISHMYFPDYTPMDYDVAQDINRRYGVNFKLPAGAFDKEKKWSWRLREDDEIE